MILKKSFKIERKQAIKWKLSARALTFPLGTLKFMTSLELQPTFIRLELPHKNCIAIFIAVTFDDANAMRVATFRRD